MAIVATNPQGPSIALSNPVMAGIRAAMAANALGPTAANTVNVLEATVTTSDIVVMTATVFCVAANNDLCLSVKSSVLTLLRALSTPRMDTDMLAPTCAIVWDSLTDLAAVSSKRLLILLVTVLTVLKAVSMPLTSVPSMMSNLPNAIMN
jgi:hypothetical protein